MNWFLDWWTNFTDAQRDPPAVSLGVESAQPALTDPKCPYPLSSDDGTMDCCKQRHHCYCEEGL